jgi:hypothetical protein
VVEHDLAKVGVEGSNPFARSKFFMKFFHATKVWPQTARSVGVLFAFASEARRALYGSAARKKNAVEMNILYRDFFPI